MTPVEFAGVATWALAYLLVFWCSLQETPDGVTPDYDL